MERPPRRAVVQAGKFGVSVSVPAAAASLESRGGIHVIGLEDGDELAAREARVTAAEERWLSLADEAESLRMDV